MKALLLMMVLVQLTACGTSPVRRYEAIAEHPDWSLQTQKLIMAGFVVKGMVRDQVIAAWGEPCLSCTGTIADSSFEYPTQLVVFNDQGKVSQLLAK